MFVEKSVFLDANATLDPVSSLTTKIEGQEFSSASWAVQYRSLNVQFLRNYWTNALYLLSNITNLMLSNAEVLIVDRCQLTPSWRDWFVGEIFFGSIDHRRDTKLPRKMHVTKIRTLMQLILQLCKVSGFEGFVF